MTRTILTLIVVLLSSEGRAPEVQRDAPKASSDTGAISGRVVAADTQVPLAGVMVMVRPADQLPTIRAGVVMGAYSGTLSASARTDAGGRFAVAGIPPGRYRLVAEPGPTAGRYLSTRFPDPALDDSAPISVSANQVVDGLVIPLPRGAVISGRVVDEAGNPMAFVAVSLQEVLPGERARPALGTSPGAQARTDDTGAFRLFALHPGEFVLSAQPMRSAALWIEPAGGPGMMPGPSFYYPGTSVLKDATRLRLEAGEEYGPLVFTVSPVRTAMVRLTVLDPGGQPATLTSVSLRAAPPSGPSLSIVSRTTNSDGTVEFPRVPTGEYVVSVAHYGPQGSLFAWSPLAVTEDVDGVTIRLQPGVAVKGRLIFEGGAPAPLPTMHVRSTPVRPGGTNSSTVMPDQDQSFTLTNQYGPTLIRADGPPGWHLKAVRVDGRDVTDAPVDFAADGPLVEVVLSRSAATLRGVVATAMGIPAESSVLLINDDLTGPERAATVRTVMTSSDGRYRVDGLRAGRYLVVATIRDDGFPSVTTPEYLDLLAGHATRVAIQDGEAKVLNLTRVVVR